MRDIRQEPYKHALRLFSLIIVIVGVYQTYRFETQDILASAAQNNSTNSSSQSNATVVPVNSSSQYDSGVTIFVTTQAQPFVKESLNRRGLPVVFKSYTLTGIEWVFNVALTYGHFVVAMYIYSAFKNPQTPQGQKLKIVGIGLVVLFAWIYFSTKIGYEKIKVVSSTGEILYHSQKAQQKQKFEIFLNQNENHKLFTIAQQSKTSDSQSPEVKVTLSENEIESGEYIERRDQQQTQVTLQPLGL